jgi:flagellar assembly protein FliH
LETESTAYSIDSQAEEVLALFQSEEARQRREQSAALPRKKTSKSFMAWQPGLLSQEAKAVKKYEWAFLEVSDTPFDKSWKTQAPNNASETSSQPENSISESEIQAMLEQARLQSEEMILAAQAQADNLLLEAQSEIDEQKMEGYQQGRKDGRAEMDDGVKAIKKVLEEVESWKTEFMAQSEQILVDMLKDISRKMFGDGAKLDTQALHSNLNRVLENARGLGNLKIFLNPNDARLLDISWSEQQMLVLGEQVKVVPSGNILPGGCLIKGNIGTVDGRVETQLDAILKTFDEPQLVEA